MFFHVYVAFFLFVVANAMTSLFVEGARRWSERDHHEVIQNQLQRKDEYRKRVSQLYHHMDRGQKGDVSYDEFVTHLSDPRLAAFAESLEIDTMDLQQFFTILSAGGRRRVDLDTFVIGCIKLRGAAKSMDLIDLLLAHKCAVNESNVRFQQCDLKLDNLELLLGHLLLMCDKGDSELAPLQLSVACFENASERGAKEVEPTRDSEASFAADSVWRNI